MQLKNRENRKLIALACLEPSCIVGPSRRFFFSFFLVFTLNKNERTILCARMPEAFDLNETRSRVTGQDWFTRKGLRAQKDETTKEIILCSPCLLFSFVRVDVCIYIFLFYRKGGGNEIDVFPPSRRRENVEITFQLGKPGAMREREEKKKRK